MKKILLLIVVMAMLQSCSMDFADNGPFSRMVHANVDESWVCDDWDYAMDWERREYGVDKVELCHWVDRYGNPVDDYRRKEPK